MIIAMIVLITLTFVFTSFAPLIAEQKDPGMFVVHPRR